MTFTSVSQMYYRAYNSQFIFWDNHTISMKIGQFIKNLIMFESIMLNASYAHLNFGF